MLGAAICCQDTAAWAETFELSVGSCPAVLSITVGGPWSNSYLSEDAVEALEANPARNATVSGVILNDAIPGGSMTVMSLGSLDRAQGQISEVQFWGIADAFGKQISDPDSDILSQVKKRINELSGGAGQIDPSYSFRDAVLIGDRRFVIIGSTSTDAENLVTAAVFQHVASCVVSIYIGLPEGMGPDAILDTIGALRVSEK